MPFFARLKEDLKWLWYTLNPFYAMLGEKPLQPHELKGLKAIRANFWRNFGTLLVVVLVVAWLSPSQQGRGCKYWVKALLIVIALSANLGRLSIAHWTDTGNSLPMRVDNLLYRLSQASTAIILGLLIDG